MRFITLLCFLLATSTVMAKDYIVATVDLQKLFKAYPGTAKAQKKFDALAKDKKAELSSSEKILTKLQKELKDSDDLTEKQKTAKQKEFQDEAQTYQDLKTHLQNELSDKQQEMTQSVLDEIKVIVNKVAAKDGVDMVVQTSDVVYMKTDMDLTDEVLKSF